jgi:glutaredoxin
MSFQTEGDPMTAQATLEPADLIIVYGLDTCEDTTRARAHLDAAAIPFQYVRLDVDQAARSRVHAAGYFATPVVVTPAGVIYMEPSDPELDAIVAAVC